MTEKVTSAPRRPWRFKDARGESVTLLDPYAMHLLRRHDVIPREPLREIADDVGPGVPRWRLIAFWVGVMLVLLFLVTIVIRKSIMRGGLRPDSVERVLWPLILLSYSFAAWRLWHNARRGRSVRVQSVMLEHLRCPHCGYDIRGLPADAEDGATVCPECGFAWRLPDSKVVAGDGDA
ncbi:MAG: zinc ribbon domain-containing protein [Phycisphaerales bacterium]|nr:MAG: zinc ribbon domain-containing protein [Phycisphaerales bacterium]